MQEVKMSPLLAEHLEILNKLMRYSKAAKQGVGQVSYIEAVAKVEQILLICFGINREEALKLMNLAHK